MVPTIQFGTSVNCMDGRVQVPVIEHMKRKYGVDCVDMVTEAGPIAILSEDPSDEVVQSIRRRVEISVMKHGSRLISVVGHHDCAGNPVDRDTQYQQIRAAMRVVDSWGTGARVIGLWVDENWEVHELE